MVKDKGLSCKFIITDRPHGQPVSERAVPVSIFQAEESIKRHFLRKWLKDSSLVNMDIRNLIDWQYYLERFGSVIQKIITIPAAMQGISNPVPRIRHPDWLHKRVAEKEDRFKQRRITAIFQKIDKNVSNIHDIMFSNDNNSLAGGEADVADMEDIFSNSNNRKGMILPKISKMTTSTEHVEMDMQPDIEVDYKGWLNHQKKKWKKMIDRQDLNLSMTVNEDTNIQNFFTRQTSVILKEPWEILQIIETDIPGDFTVWALINKSIYSIKLQIPRKFYVNSRVLQPEDLNEGGFTMRRRQKTLPRSHVCLNLYEFSMPEGVFRNHTETFAKMFNHQDIEGVYETQVPLLFRGLINIGCIASVSDKRAKSGRGIDTVFELDELRHMSPSKNPYLKYSHLNYLYLFHAGTRTRQIFALFSTATDKVTICFIDPARNRDAIPNFSRLYREKRLDRIDRETLQPTQYQISSQQTQGNSSLKGFTYPEFLEFSTSTHSTDSDGVLTINQAIRDYQDSRRGPTLLIIQSQKTPVNLHSLGISLLADFPYVTTPSHKADHSLPALGWQNHIASRMMSHFFNVNGWLNERIELARYADIPIGNIENDYPIFLADLAFSRRLDRADMVLWYSRSDKPDLGGREQDDNKFELDELVNPEMNFPGSYSNVCLEIEIFNLAFNTILQSTQINDLEGFSGSVADGMISNVFEDQLKDVNNEINGAQLAASLLSTSDESHINQKTIKLIREMVQAWHYQFQSKKDKLAQMMLEHLYRWLTSSSSRLHDPSLYLMVHGMMRKVFMQLIAEFRKMGSTVVYAR
jgi:DNA polymerase epsilon subunit 1